MSDTRRALVNGRLRTAGGMPVGADGSNQSDINAERAAIGRGMASGGPGYEYFQGQLGQTQAVQDAAPNTAYRGTSERAFGDMAQGAQNRDAILAQYNDAMQARGMGMGARSDMQAATGLAGMAARGLGPSAAQAQLQQGSDAAARMAMAQAASARGGVARAGAARMGAMGAQDATQNAAAQAAALRAQEMQQAMQLYGGLAGQLRGSDMQQQGMDANMAQFQAQMGQQNRAQNDQFAMGLMGLGQNASRAQQASDMQNQQAFMSNFQQSQAHKNAMDAGYAGHSLEENKRPGQYAANAGMAALSMLPMVFSDERVKKDVKDGDEKLDELFEKLGAHDYEYKSKKYGEKGRHVSPMAQEIEKSEIGKRAVVDTKEGKMVDYGKLLPAVVSEVARQRKQLTGLMSLAGGDKKKKVA